MVENRIDSNPDERRGDPPPWGTTSLDDVEEAAIAERVWSRRSTGSTKPVPIPHFPPPRG